MPNNQIEPTAVYEWTFEAIGTSWWIGIYQSISPGDIRALQLAITDLAKQYDKTYSRFRTDSLVTRISQQAGEYRFPPEAVTLFKLYRQLYEASNGLVTPLIGNLLSQAGYDAQYSLQPAVKLDAVPLWDDVLTWQGDTLTVRQPVLLDFGAAGKGQLVDIISTYLEAQGIEAFCVDGSGDMRVTGLDTTLRIGMEQPDDVRQIVGVIELTNQALCASAPNRRQWGDFHHIMDPAQHKSPQHTKAIWVTADDCLVADGLTTALFFVNPIKLTESLHFEYAILEADGRLIASPGFPAQFFYD